MRPAIEDLAAKTSISGADISKRAQTRAGQPIVTHRRQTVAPDRYPSLLFEPVLLERLELKAPQERLDANPDDNP